MLHPQRYALMLKLKTSALNVSHCLNTWVDIESTARRRWEGVGRDGPVRRPADTRGLSIQAAFSHPFFAGRKVEEYMTDLHQVASVTTRHHAIRALVTFTLLAASGVTSAQTSDDAQPTVVVTASRTEQVVTDTLPHTSVIDREAIEQSPAQDVLSLLRTQSGVSIRQNGGQGSLSGVSIRGGEPRHTLILIDGVPMNNLSAGTAALEQLPLSAIERIEIVRGNVSTLYGSQAVGGVVQIFTRRVQNTSGANLRIAGGNAGQRQASAQLNLAGEKLSATFGVSHEEIKAISAQNAAAMKKVNAYGNVNPDKDGYKSESLNANIRYRPNENNEFGVRLLDTRGKNQYDSAYGTADSIQFNKTQVTSASLYSDNRIMDNWRSHLRVSQYTDRSNDFNSPVFYGTGESYYKTSTQEISWQNDIHTQLGEWVAGVSRSNQRLSSDTMYDNTTRSTNSLWAGYTLDKDRHHLQLNARTDKLTGMKRENTGAVHYSFDLAPKLRVIAGYSNGFAAPNFNELYYPGYSNPKLKAEHANYTELGLQYADEGYGMRVTGFNTLYRDKIGTDALTYLPVNISRARAMGVEYHGWMNMYGFDVNLGLTYQSVKNRDTGVRLLRQPRVIGSLGVGKTIGKWNGQIDWTVQSHMSDVGKTRVAGFGVVNAAIYYAPVKDVKIGLTLNNLFNRHYQTLYGYNGTPRTVLLSLQYQPSFK